MSLRGGHRAAGAPWRFPEASLVLRCTSAHLYRQATRSLDKGGPSFTTIEIGGLRLIPDPEMVRLTGLTSEQLVKVWGEIVAVLAQAPPKPPRARPAGTPKKEPTRKRDRTPPPAELAPTG